MVDQQNSPDNHSDWSYPAPGYDDPSPTWGEILNALIEDDLDRAVVIKDTYANRPAAGEQGRWFLATDRKIVFYDDGAAWEAVAGKGTQANPVPGTTYLESLSVERIGSRSYAGAADGGDADARLDNTLAEASDGDIILLEGGGATYADNRTISDQLLIRGCNDAGKIVQTEIAGNWTVDAACGLVNLHFSGDTTLTAQHSTVRACNGAFGTITIAADGCAVVIGRDHDVTFESGTSGGLADALWQSNVTDNGTNTVGTIG